MNLTMSFQVASLKERLVASDAFKRPHSAVQTFVPVQVRLLTESFWLGTFATDVGTDSGVSAQVSGQIGSLRKRLGTTLHMTFEWTVTGVYSFVTVEIRSGGKGLFALWARVRTYSVMNFRVSV